MFKTTSNNGFHITFANGYKVSVQWNPHNYCSDRSGRIREAERRGCESVEVAAWDEVTGDWVKLSEHDDVSGWQSADDVLAIMNRVAAMEPTVSDVIALPAPEEHDPI